jgi:adenylosuccinate synthase
MSSLVVIGAQWGDEGKGKLVDYLTRNVDYVVRFQGGNNAGHTVVVDGAVTKLNLIPSGILHEKVCCLLGAGVVLDGVHLIEELNNLKQGELAISPSRFVIDENAELVLEYHRAIDKAREVRKSKDQKIGTTGKGIGPAYEDKVARTGVRFAELSRLDLLKPKLEETVAYKNRYLRFVLESDIQVSFEEVWIDIQKISESLLQYKGNVTTILNEAIVIDKKIVYEGAQGTLLDINFGCKPFVTSSNTIAGGVSTGCGIGPHHVGYVLGVAKAYSTRVGSGPFPTELQDMIGDKLRDNGNEYGTVTKRPRRCGWFDAVLVKYAVKLSGMQSLALTKLDVLAGFEKIKLCHRYLKTGTKVTTYPTLSSDFDEITPDYIELEGWDADIVKAKKWHELPASAKLYIQAVSEIVECPVDIVSVGAERESTIFSSHAEHMRNFL